MNENESPPPAGGNGPSMSKKQVYDLAMAASAQIDKLLYEQKVTVEEARALRDGGIAHVLLSHILSETRPADLLSETVYPTSWPFDEDADGREAPHFDDEVFDDHQEFVDLVLDTQMDVSISILQPENGSSQTVFVKPASWNGHFDDCCKTLFYTACNLRAVLHPSFVVVACCPTGGANSQSIFIEAPAGLHHWHTLIEEGVDAMLEALDEGRAWMKPDAEA